MSTALQEIVSELVGSGATTAVAAIIGCGDVVRQQPRAGWRDAGRKTPLGFRDRFDSNAVPDMGIQIAI